jgi:hypothetical protein
MFIPERAEMDLSIFTVKSMSPGAVQMVVMAAAAVM